MNLTQNYFELFQLPQTYEVDQKQLSGIYRQLQKQFHPDRYATHPVSEQRMAVQFTAYINSGYQTLLSPVKRAEYLLSLYAEAVDLQTATTSDVEFLMQQMQWREQLAEIKSDSEAGNVSDKLEGDLENLLQCVSEESSLLQQKISQLFTEQQFSIINTLIEKLHFIEKMQQEIEMLEDQLLD